MRAYVLNLWDTASTSYWFVPTLFAAAALLLSLSMPFVDTAIAGSGWQLPEWIRTTTETARASLSAIAGAILAVTSTVFSITIVTLSLTSQQFGPRLLRRFMYDLPTKVTLGVFLSTGFYCLLVLRVVEHHDGGPAAPHLSVLVAVALAVVSMVMLIVFIHHVAMLIQAPHVVAAVASDLDNAIVRLFPEKTGESPSDAELKQGAVRDQEKKLGNDCIVIRSTHEGYIQAIDGDGLMHMACKHDLVIRLRCRPGDFIALDTPLVDVWLVDERPEEERSNDRLVALLNDKIIVGIRRTPRQDVGCAINELVEVAVRSLSPGINDPFTAINCIDRLGAALGRLAERKVPSAYRCDEEGRMRVIVHPVSFADVLDAAFNQIRQYGHNSVAVTIRLLEALASVAEHVHRDEDREAVATHALMISRLAKAFSEEHDRQGLREQFGKVIELLSSRTPLTGHTAIKKQP